MPHTFNIRIPRSLLNRVSADLSTPHPYAYERVGFLSTSLKVLPDDSALLIINDYLPVADGAYVPDDFVGARIDSSAIRSAMQWSLDTKRGCFHVHMHGGRGIPYLSTIDRKELPRLVHSLRAAAPSQAHGIFLLSADACNCWVWLPGETEPITPSRISIVGYPIGFIPLKVSTEKRNTDRFSRQSFLGSASQNAIEGVRVGVVGLGGGGSHIVQQIAHVGVRHLCLFDDDSVEETNLNRLVGATAADVSNKTDKTDVAIRTIRSLTPDATITAYKGKWQDCPEQLEQCDIVFGCVDSFQARRELEATCRRYLIPYIDIGMDVYQEDADPPRMAGQVILSLPGKPCMHCLGYLTERNLAKEAALYGKAGNRPQVVWANGVLASTAVGIFIDILTGWTGKEGKEIFLSYDGNENTITSDRRLNFLNIEECVHYPLENAGPPIWR